MARNKKNVVYFKGRPIDLGLFVDLATSIKNAVESKTDLHTPDVGYIYLIRSNGVTKIGRTINFKDRNMSYKTHTPELHEVICVIPVLNFDAVESKLHFDYKEFRIGSKEWFNLSQDQIDKIVLYLESIKVQEMEDNNQTDDNLILHVHNTFQIKEKEVGKNENLIKTPVDNNILLQKVHTLGVEYGTLSTSFLQSKLKIGYPRAKRIIDMLTDDGYLHSPTLKSGKIPYNPHPANKNHDETTG